MRILLTSIALCSILSFTHVANAQFGGSTTQQGGFGGNSSSGMSGFGGSSSGGMSGFGSSSGGSSSGFGGTSSGSNFGSTTAGSTSTGMFGSRTTGGTIRSGRNRGTANGSGGDAQIGEIGSGDRFLRNNRQAGQFVGAADNDSFQGMGAGTQAIQSLVGLRQARSLQQNMNQILGQQQGGGNNNSKTKRTIRSIKSVDFPYAGPAPSVLSQEISDRLNRVEVINAPGAGNGVTVEMAGRVAILRGHVADQHAQELAGRLIMLEPGVSKVQNELTYPEAVAPAVK